MYFSCFVLILLNKAFIQPKKKKKDSSQLSLLKLLFECFPTIDSMKKITYEKKKKKNLRKNFIYTTPNPLKKLHTHTLNMYASMLLIPFRSVPARMDGISRTGLKTGTRIYSVPPRLQFRPISANFG